MAHPQSATKYAAIGCNTSGNNTLVAAVTDKKIRVLSMFLIAAAAVNVYCTSNAGGTVILGHATHKITLAAGGDGFVLTHNPEGWFETSSGHLLNLNLSGAVAVSGCLTYVEVNT